MKLTREFYIPTGEGVEAEVYPNEKVTVYRYQSGAKYIAKCFGGQRSKPDMHYAYRTEEAREEAIQKYVDGQRATLKFKAARRATRKAPHTLAIGSIVYNSWGYEQTNVDFYEVVDKPSTHFVVIRKVAQDTIESNGSSDHVVPMPGKYLEDGKRAKASAHNTIKIGHTYASEWDGQPKYQTAFGFGH